MHAQHNANAGTKGAAKAMNKIAQGPLYKEGTTWFRQLSDKRMSVSCHTVYIHVHQVIQRGMCCKVCVTSLFQLLYCAQVSKCLK